METKKIVEKEAVHCVSDEKGKLIAILRRDPVTGKHITYLTEEATCDDIVDKLIQPDFALSLTRKTEKKLSTTP